MQMIKDWVERGNFEKQAEDAFKAMQLPAWALIWFAVGFFVNAFTRMMQG